MNDVNDFWRKCSSCKHPILYGAKYQSCSVSTCKKYVYCSVSCWNVHVPVMNHKNAWAEEETAPKASSGENVNRQTRRIIVNKKSSTKKSSGDIPHEVLVVASKLKSYIKAKADMNTSANVMDRFSDIIRSYCDEAIEKATLEGRKTIMDRDFNK